MIVDLSMYNVAAKMGEYNNTLMKVPVLYEKGAHGYAAVEDYNSYRGISYRCKDANEFLRTYNYIDISFPNKDIEAYLSSGKTYSNLSVRLTDEIRKELGVEELEKCKKKVAILIKEANSINGDWAKILLDNLNTLRKWLQTASRKSIERGLNDKMRLYLLKLLSAKSLNSDDSSSVVIDRLYAAVLGSKENNVKSDLERLRKPNLGYENYNLLVRNLEIIYRHIDGLGDKVTDRKWMLDRIVADLIPQGILSKQWREILNSTEFENDKLEEKVRNATKDYYEK